VNAPHDALILATGGSRRLGDTGGIRRRDRHQRCLGHGHGVPLRRAASALTGGHRPVLNVMNQPALETRHRTALLVVHIEDSDTIGAYDVAPSAPQSSPNRSTGDTDANQ
jgi:hypothetical protein